jgi:tryptophan synthase alpha chain
MNRIDKLFQNKRKNNLSIYITAGYPQIDSTTEIIKYLSDSGVDMIEIGMPFSDPLADGPVIQGSSEQALKNGMNMKLLFDQLADIRKTITIPLLLMGYINPVLRFGMENFCRKCADTGIDGIILPDMPPELYSGHYSGLFEESGLYNILLISPQTENERIWMIDRISRGFIYMVSSSSTTGIRRSFSEEQIAYFRRIMEMKLHNPLMVGFGISDKQSFDIACRESAGAIIGSAFIKMLHEKGADPEDIRRFLNEIRGV